MIILLFRLLLFAAIIILLYSAYKYLMNPKRKLEVAQEKKAFYFLDDADNIQKNFLITYKGFIFEGEKYVGTTEDSLEVVNVIVYTHQPEQLHGFERKDLYFLEEEILMRYPYAKVEWKHPINRLHLH
ncbi:hypothetical protein J416_07632 [Gracilibacillus halophilus YIM-C55.5]|uniref:Sigma-w pathway protein ysdB n=1 Tax=Gracilibacillus halophilus YIM-C55.5 TaxID=1308866 RepID=N4WCV1_9BACI|nr:hypothetical protein [Gracilibacillus halophilus]ENH97049.1 hypothetical protein J416_07632 [Gracilibacillus halophilus YIM-C55.5]